MRGLPERHRGLLLRAVLVGACLLVYSNSFQGVFHMDDTLRILDDPSVRAPLASITGTSRPLTGVSIWFNWSIGGGLAGFHAFNLAVHIGAALALFSVLMVLYRRWTVLQDSPRSAGTLAFLAALLWAVHPLNTQSVTYIVQRAESVMGLFFLLSMVLALRRMETQAGDGVRRGVLDAAAGVCAVLAVAAKPVMVVGPVLILLADAAAVSGSVRQALYRHRRLYLALSAGLLAGAVLLLLPNESTTTVGPGQGLISPWRYALTQGGVILRYLRLSVWPVGQCFDYAWPPATLGPRPLLEAAVVVALLVLSLRAWRHGQVIGYAGLFCLIALAPTSSFIPIADSASEHRMYVPLMAVSAVAVGLGFLGVRRLAVVLPDRAPRLGVLAALMAVVALGSATFARNALYGSTLSLARDSALQRPDNFRAWSVVSNALLAAGRPDEALQAASQVLGRAERRAAEGGVYSMAGAMNANGYMPVLLNNKGRILLALNAPAQALPLFQQAVAWRPEFKPGFLNAALALTELEAFDQALETLDQALALDPACARAYTIRGAVYRRLGRLDESEAALRHALRLGDEAARHELDADGVRP